MTFQARCTILCNSAVTDMTQPTTLSLDSRPIPKRKPRPAQMTLFKSPWLWGHRPSGESTATHLLNVVNYLLNNMFITISEVRAMPSLDQRGFLPKWTIQSLQAGQSGENKSLVLSESAIQPLPRLKDYLKRKMQQIVRSRGQEDEFTTPVLSV